MPARRLPAAEHPRGVHRRSLLGGLATLSLAPQAVVGLTACTLLGAAGPSLAQEARGRATTARDRAARARQRLRIVVAYPPGGVSDRIARTLASWWQEHRGAIVVVDHRPGAGGALALEQLAHSQPDGGTLVFAAATAVELLASRRPGLPSDADGLPVAPVAGVMRTPVLVVGTPALVADSFDAMIRAAHNASEGIRWATTGVGTTGHAVLEQVRRASGAPIVHVPYKGGGQQISDALAGQFEVLSTNVAAQQLELIAAGRLRPLAVGAPARVAVLPQVPTLGELGMIEANLDSLFGLYAPLRTNQSTITALHDDVAAALRDATLRQSLVSTANAPFDGSTAEFRSQVLRVMQSASAR